MQAANKLKSVFTKGAGASLGVWQMIPSANVSHRAMHDAVPAIAAAGVSPIVRIPDIQASLVKRALDCGAHGVRPPPLDSQTPTLLTRRQVLVPLLRTAQEAKDLVQAAKFPPWGRRGFGSPFAMERFTPAPSMTEYLQQANGSLLTMVQIETQEALDAVDDIAAVEGIDNAANNIGHPVIDGVMKPELHEAIARVLEATHKAGKKAGIFCTSGEQGKQYAEQGFDMISVATDFTILQHAVADAVSVARDGPRPAKGTSY
ncbi:2,4-dihydroxyhept-2-ene-1,7-dioic acid aldolase [Verticillium alfalfae VaMs.102]|uniref:2,4-dihydroxyhept-2-ene-1,7-dioic acid aldolase n=1 Tax=Verticillium alfalfae (strain VaMs.102 / ATCC MYA-4576 / FGSC 10136) TaxID=526221 RepID=C9SU79_VERA1|nr:2,4-dihydroxyhept-2-ene-1,7-dioic acid aldolase [Verticillium alfalfae VaMs.102]EEY22390.1 2,4-dihydroxyhept-2-ene-1,7-dioic acid aldolase [Verticillium alfalfae VaMs.102]